MKSLSQFPLWLVFLVLPSSLLAVNPANTNDILYPSCPAYAIHAAKSINNGVEHTGYGSQKAIKKSVALDLVKSHKSKSAKRQEAKPRMKKGLLSVLFGVAGIVTIFLPGSLAILGLIFSLAGVGFGIVGLRKDEDPTLALIGTVLGGLMLALFAIILIA